MGGDTIQPSTLSLSECDLTPGALSCLLSSHSPGGLSHTHLLATPPKHLRAFAPAGSPAWKVLRAPSSHSSGFPSNGPSLSIP